MTENFENIENIDKNDLNAIKKIAVHVCRQYLISWKLINIDDFNIEKISYVIIVHFIIIY
jgi:hypothetical protein